MLGRDGKPAPLMAGTTGESFNLAITCLAEPKLHALQFPGRLDITEAVDESGHSLIRPATGPGIRQMQALSPAMNVSVLLAYPPEAGHTIKHFAATGQFVVLSKSEHVSIDKPLKQDDVEKQVAGMTVTIGKPTWTPQNSLISWMVTYQRGDMDPDAWAAVSKVFSTVRPVAQGDPDLQFLAGGSSIQAPVGDRATATYRIMVTTRTGGARLTQEPAVDTMSMDIPTEVQQVTVPVEFHDLPLP
jgi:hypothetical protein